MNYLYELIFLISFVECYEFVKFFISEDLGIIKKIFKEWGYGILEIILGVVGGVLFIFEILYEEVKKYIEFLVECLLE